MILQRSQKAVLWSKGLLSIRLNMGHNCVFYSLLKTYIFISTMYLILDSNSNLVPHFGENFIKVKSKIAVTYILIRC